VSRSSAGFPRPRLPVLPLGHRAAARAQGREEEQKKSGEGGGGGGVLISQQQRFLSTGRNLFQGHASMPAAGGSSPETGENRRSLMSLEPLHQSSISRLEEEEEEREEEEEEEEERGGEEEEEEEGNPNKKTKLTGSKRTSEMIITRSKKTTFVP